jgi:enamine deaminase RidA (YjgF/YER057c/UK114 family)
MVKPARNRAPFYTKKWFCLTGKTDRLRRQTQKHALKTKEPIMSGKIETRLDALGITLPQANAPVANYLPYVRSGNLVNISGQITMENGELKFIGKLGKDYGVEDGQKAARLCALNLVAQLRAAIGDLDKVTRVVKLNAFVNSAPDFTDQPKVVNGASDTMVEIFGDAGKHARSAVGVASLPLGVAVEIDGVFEVAD